MTLKEIYTYLNKEYPLYHIEYHPKEKEEVLMASLHETRKDIDIDLVMALVNDNEFVITMLFNRAQINFANLNKINRLNEEIMYLGTAYIDTKNNIFVIGCRKYINTPKEAGKVLQAMLDDIVKYKKYLPDFYNTNKMD